MKPLQLFAWPLSLLLLLAGLGSAGCGSEPQNTPTDSLKADTLAKDTLRKDSLPPPPQAATQFSPILRVPIQENVNIVYTVGFQLGWDYLKKMAGEKIMMKPAPEILQDLNNAPGSFRDISRGSSIGLAGSPGYGVASQFGFQFSQKFPEDDTLLTDLDSVRSAIVGYAYKNTTYGFRLPYYANALQLQDRLVDCFGIGSEGALNHWGNWVTVHDFQDPDNWVASISSDTLTDRLVIAKISEPHPLMLRNIYDVQHRMEFNQTPGLQTGDRLIIPAFHFETHERYPILENVPLQNAYFNGLPIETALHLFRIGIGDPNNQSGFKPDWNAEGREMVADKMFLLMVWEKEAPYPWLAMWIENSQLMWSSP
jgi:hypothetical protein